MKAVPWHVFGWRCRPWAGVLLALIPGASSLSPYDLLDGWAYFLEADRGQAWPDCPKRFLGHSADCSSISLVRYAGADQRFELEVPFSISRQRARTFYINTVCGRYLRYSTDCDETTVDTWIGLTLGHDRRFRFVPIGAFAWSLEAVGRAACPARLLGFPGHCGGSGSDALKMQLPGRGPVTWRLHAASAPLAHRHFENNPDGCADPFVWRASDGRYRMICSSGRLPLFEAPSIAANSTFVFKGGALGGRLPNWTAGGADWAPENVKVAGTHNNLVEFSAARSRKGTHHIGWVMSSEGPNPGAWSNYSKAFLDLGGASGGEIDGHIFKDDDGEEYLVWKTDDNHVGKRTTRIWARRCRTDVEGLEVQGPMVELLDSSGLWWVNSFVADGSLVEGPEIVHRGDYYYLFFASGRYCQASYAEGVARAKHILGPYTKLLVPVLSTGMVGYSAAGEKLVGPGHASFVKDTQGSWRIVYHASPGPNCRRHAYVDNLEWTEDDWPYVNFTPPGTTTMPRGVDLLTRQFVT